MEFFSAEWIGTVGFPIVVTSFLLLRFDNTIRDLTKSINENIGGKNNA